MKRMLGLLLICFMAGCAYEGKTFGEYLGDPKTIIQDPHYMEYRSKRDQLEADYLNKRISYSQYLSEVKILDENYAREVNKRNEIITNK